MVVTLAAILPAQRVAGCIVCRWNGMDNAIIDKGLQGPVHSDPVEPITRDLFDVVMGKRIFRLQEGLQDHPPAVRIA